MKAIYLALLVAAASLTGCAANVQRSAGNSTKLVIPPNSARQVVMDVTGSQSIVASADWEQFKGEWRAAMKAATSAAGLGYAVQEDPPRPTGEPGTLVVIHINDYRYLSTGARVGLGVMTGNAYVDSKVSFLDLQNGAQLGDRAYNTSSSAWQGVFSAMTEKQVQAICKQIVSDIGAH